MQSEGRIGGGNWCIAGDFNAVLCRSERRGVLGCNYSTNEGIYDIHRRYGAH